MAPQNVDVHQALPHDSRRLGLGANPSNTALLLIAKEVVRDQIANKKLPKGPRVVELGLSAVKVEFYD